MMQFISSCSKRENLFFIQLQIKMVLLFLLTIYVVTGTELDNEDLMKVMQLERKQKQWIEERRTILNRQMPFVNDMLDRESQHINLEITNANVLKITNHVVLRVILPFLTLQDFVGMYTINKNVYNFIRKNYSIGGDKKLDILTFHPILPTLNVPHDLIMQTDLAKIIGSRIAYPLSALHENLPHPYEAIVMWRGAVKRSMRVLWCNILYEADTHRFLINFPDQFKTAKSQEDRFFWSPIVVDSVNVPCVLVRNHADYPTEVYRFAWFDLPLHDRNPEMHPNWDLRVYVIYQNVDIPGQFITWVLNLPYDPSRKCHIYCGFDSIPNETDGVYKLLNRPFMFPEIINK